MSRDRRCSPRPSGAGFCSASRAGSTARATCAWWHRITGASCETGRRRWSASPVSWRARWRCPRHGEPPGRPAPRRNDASRARSAAATPSGSGAGRTTIDAALRRGHMRRLIVDPASPDPVAIAAAAAVLRAGGLVAFPTETVYGLGADALDPAAVRRIYEAKGRPGLQPGHRARGDDRACAPPQPGSGRPRRRAWPITSGLDRSRWCCRRT